MTFPRVLVVGAGQMGGGIAQVIAASGRHVFLHDQVPGACERALAAISRSLTRLAEKGGGDPAEALGRIEVVPEFVPSDLDDRGGGRGRGDRRRLFERADAELDAETVLASNTGSIPIGIRWRQAAPGSRRVIGMHFFNQYPCWRWSRSSAAPHLGQDRGGRGRARPRAGARSPVEASTCPGSSPTGS